MTTHHTKRILFDLDGTLFDTQRLHAEVEATLIRTHGAGVVVIDPDELTRRFAGRPSRMVFKEVLRCSPEDAQRLCDRKWEILMPRYAEAAPLADLCTLFRVLTEGGVRLAIGTASPREWAIHILQHHNVMRYFPWDSIVGGDMVQEGKPHPEIWQKAMGDVNPRECLVVEDGIAGIDAAKSAGIPAALLVPRRHPYAHVLENLEGILSFVGQ